jgi:hypothetical protein
MNPRLFVAATARCLLIAALAAVALTVDAGTSWAVPDPSAPPELPSSPPSLSLNFGDWIIKQINLWFATLVAAAMNPALDALAVTVLATPDVAGNERLFDLWTATAAIANSAFVLLATIGAITAMGHQTVQTRYAVKEVLPRLAMAILATNTSFLICGKIVEAVNALSKAIVGEDFDSKRAAAQLRQLILPPSNSQIFYTLLALVAIILLVLLLISFLMRAALVLLLVVAAPLALALHALPQTDGLARFWWRAFGGLLIIQVGQSLTLILAVRIFFNQDGRFLLGAALSGQLINLILALCLLIILVRIPSWISRRVFAQSGGRSTLARIVKYAVISKLTAPVLRGMNLGRSGNAGRGQGKSGVGKTATRAVTGKVVATAIGGPAGTAAATALTAGSHTRGVAGAVGQAPIAGGHRTASPTAPAQPATPQPQPRWQAANRRWMPPDPHARVAWGTSEAPQAHQRWSANPVQPWTPPDRPPASEAGQLRRPEPPPSRPATITSPPATPTAWVPPGNNPAAPAPASGQGRRPRRRGGEGR